MNGGKTGTMGRAWVTLDRDRPPRVPGDSTDRMEREGDEPISDRCAWWLRQIDRGWLPPRRWTQECVWCLADLFGVWGWECREVIQPLLGERFSAATGECDHTYRDQRVHGGRDPHSQMRACVCVKCGKIEPGTSRREETAEEPSVQKAKAGRPCGRCGNGHTVPVATTEGFVIGALCSSCGLQDWRFPHEPPRPDTTGMNPFEAAVARARHRGLFNGARRGG